jgi:riboflavin synthase
LDFDLSAETLERTWFAELTAGRLLNLERAMSLGHRLGGHLVSGHVDGVGRIVEIQDSGDGGAVFTFEVAAGLDRYLIEKGSVTVDGISLTVVEPRGCVFDVAVIPLTLSQTSLGRAQVGERVNVEADLVGKWIERLLPYVKTPRTGPT